VIRALPAKLFSGAHSPDGEMCVMEAVAWVAGEAWTDTPECACPVITRFAQSINDSMGDEFRQRLLPYVPRLIGTRSTWAVEQRRALRAAAKPRMPSPIASPIMSVFLSRAKDGDCVLRDRQARCEETLQRVSVRLSDETRT